MPGVNPERNGTTEALMPSILVVDGDADTCRNMADLFGDLGYVVDAAHGGDMALEKAGQQPYDLGLLGLRMPGMDALTFCRHLNRLHPRMVTMIITAYGASSLAEEARDAVARQILPKPVDFPILLALVEQALPCTN
jgi:two-component system response regulator AlgR